MKKKSFNITLHFLALTLALSGLIFAILNNKKDPEPAIQNGVPVEGVAYGRLVSPINGIEENNITELFWYGCPHCYNAEPFAEKVDTFATTKGYTFEKVHFYVPNEIWSYDFNVYVALKALGVEEKVGINYMKAVQGIDTDRLDRNNIDSFLEQYGLSKSLLSESLVSKEGKEISEYAKSFKDEMIEGTPAFIIAGKYVLYDSEDYEKTISYLIENQP